MSSLEQFDMNKLTNSMLVNAEQQPELTPQDTKSNIDTTSLWRLIRTHALGFLTLVMFQTLVSLFLPLSPALGGFAMCASYFTLCSVWLTFGNSGERAWAIPLAFVCFVAQSTLLYLLGEANVSYVLGFGFVAVIYSLGLIIPMIILRVVTLARVERMSQMGGLYTERFNFGIGEIIFATAVVAILLALAKLVVADWKLLALLATVPSCSLLNFVLITPILILTLSSRFETFVVGLSLLSMIATFVGELMVCREYFQFELSSSSIDLAMFVLINVTFFLTTFLHLLITRFSGYRLVRLQLD